MTSIRLKPAGLVPDDFDPDRFLETDVIYVCEDTDDAWLTPDGVGCYWFDSEDEAREEYPWAYVQTVSGEDAENFYALR